MAQQFLSCFSLQAHFKHLFAQCAFTSSEERQRIAKEKLEKEISHLNFETRRLELQVEECNKRKTSLLKQSRLKEAKDVVREKHKILKKLDKMKELLNFTEGLLEQITNTTVLRHTMSTLHEAQNLYLSMDVGTLNRRFNKLSERFATVQDQVAETQEMVNSHIAPPLSQDDEDLLAELESCRAEEAPARAEAPASPYMTPPTLAEPMTVADAYRREGLLH
jgi:hypothetical protein